MWCAVVFAVLAVLVGVVRRSWFGRQLTAIRDSELAAATLGLPVRSTKVAIFAVSGFIAGCAGALFGGLSGAVQGTQFEPVNSLVILLFAFVGGITTVARRRCSPARSSPCSCYAESTFADLGRPRVRRHRRRRHRASAASPTAWPGMLLDRRASRCRGRAATAAVARRAGASPRRHRRRRAVDAEVDA